MKKYKFLIPVIFSVLIGFILGNAFFNRYNDISSVFENNNTAYYIEIASYNTVEDAKKNYDNDSFILEDNEGFHKYVGLTKNLSLANKIKAIYQNLGNNTYIVEKVLDNTSLYSLLDEYDKILASIDNDEDIKALLKVISSKYREMNITDAND